MPTRPGIHFFEGRFFRCGALVDECDLRPTPDYPLVPLLLEFAGNDRTGRGHNRSNDIHVLWRFNAASDDFEELARVFSQGPEWFFGLVPIVKRELHAPPVKYVELAGAVSSRVLAMLDGELEPLGDEGRARVMSFLYDQFTARLVA